MSVLEMETAIGFRWKWIPGFPGHTSNLRT